jgi:hypothetical protein
MTIPFQNRIRPAENVLIRELDGESVLLNLDRERYFGLDDVGTRMWSVVTSSETIQAAYDTLAAEYDVGKEALRQDLCTLIDEWMEHELVQTDAE